MLDFCLFDVSGINGLIIKNAQWISLGTLPKIIAHTQATISHKEKNFIGPNQVHSHGSRTTCCLDINELTASHVQVMIHCLSSTHRDQGTHIYVVKLNHFFCNISLLSVLHVIQIIWNDLYYCHYSLPNFHKHRLVFWIQITEHAWMHCKA